MGVKTLINGESYTKVTNLNELAKSSFSVEARLLLTRKTINNFSFRDKMFTAY